MSRIQTQITRLSIVAMALGAGVASLPARALAACGDPSGGLNAGVNCGPGGITLQAGITRTVNLLLFIVGVAAVIVMIVGGIRYVTSGGDPKNTQAAKDTILYAVIGIVVALLAYAIVNFVVTQFS